MRFLALCAALSGTAAFAQLTPGRIPQSPDIHGDKITFCAEGDIWIGDLKSGVAERLTVFPAEEANPRFSPDGTQIAFTGRYDGGKDVYVVSVDGGNPARVTYVPGGADMQEWTPDGASVMFRSGFENGAGDPQLFTASIKGGPWNRFMMGKAAQGSLSKDGSMVAYVKSPLEGHLWKRYRGGQANDIWLNDTAAKTFTKLTASDINEQYPCFVGDRLFYVSEEKGSANLWEVNPKSKARKQVTEHSTYDVKSPASDGKRIIYRFGQDLMIYNPGTDKSEKVKMKLSSDAIHTRAYMAATDVQDFSAGPSGARILINGRGQIWSAPARNGELRPIITWPGTRNQLPRYSPAGDQIAFVSDRSDEWNIWTAEPDGTNAKQLTELTGASFSQLAWAPNGKFLIATDASSTTWKIDLDGKLEKLYTDDYGAPGTFSADRLRERRGVQHLQHLRAEFADW
jgi:tricorn protease